MTGLPLSLFKGLFLLAAQRTVRTRVSSKEAVSSAWSKGGKALDSPETRSGGSAESPRANPLLPGCPGGLHGLCPLRVCSSPATLLLEFSGSSPPASSHASSDSSDRWRKNGGWSPRCRELSRRRAQRWTRGPWGRACCLRSREPSQLSPDSASACAHPRLFLRSRGAAWKAVGLSRALRSVGT